MQNRNPLEETVQQMRAQIAAQAAELERVRALPNQQQIIRNAQLPPAPAVPVQRDFTNEICNIIGNVESNQFHIKTPEFKDETEMNPLEFMDEYMLFCKIKIMT